MLTTDQVRLVQCNGAADLAAIEMQKIVALKMHKLLQKLHNSKPSNQLPLI